MEVKKPIFIVSVGRSGSTIFHRMFSQHSKVAWISNRLLGKVPGKPYINRWLLSMLDSPVIGPLLQNRFKPGEAYAFWEYHCPGFSEPCRDLLPFDVTNKIKKSVPQSMSQILTTKRHRLLIKITGWPRIGFLHEIFPDAKFVHVSRDNREVINSMINIDWWRGWHGPYNWRWGTLTPEQYAEWERFDRSFIALAGIEMRILEAAMEKAKQYIDPKNFLEVRYDDLCNNPIDIFKRVIAFSELDWSENFEHKIKRYLIKDSSYKWREELTEEQKKIIEYYI
jgi:hypothetical protein